MLPCRIPNLLLRLVILPMFCACVVTGCNSGQAERDVKVAAEKAALSKAAYQRYINYLDALPQTGITVTQSGPYKIASYDTSAFSNRVRELEAQIKKDMELEGTETTGDKGKLLTRLKTDSTTINPFNTAQAINRKTEADLALYIKGGGVQSLQSPGVMGAVISLRGFEAAGKLSRSNNVNIQENVDKVFSGGGDTGTITNN